METKKTTREEYQKCVNAVVDYINLHLGEAIDLISLSKISHFSPFYFHRIMKAFLGEPVGTFIVRTRTETAARLLRYTDLPIADIAYRIGYSSSSSLSKVFKQFYGISPLEYRNNKIFVIEQSTAKDSNIDGNDFDQIEAAFKEARKTKGMPTAIIAKTIKGKGVSFMEDQAGWHGKAPNDEQYAQAMEELEQAGEALCQK